MIADTVPPAELAALIDVHSHRVTATPAGLRGELLAILTATADGRLADGHPCLNGDMARQLGNALLVFADGEPR